MNRKLKINFVIITGILMIVSWAVLFLMGSKDQTINYVWQAFMALFAVVYGFLGITTAIHWGGTKSSNGQGVLSISLGLISWGLGQAGWTYYLFAEPNVQSPSNHFIDTLYMLAIPLWAFGIYKLSKATGARYGLKSMTAKLLLAILTVIAILISYYLLVNVARGGPSFIQESFWKAFFDIGYVFGDVLLMTMVVAIYGLSWNYLGGIFKRPMIIMFISFVFLYLADFWWAFRDGKELYFNGDTPDLFYVITVILFGLGLTLLDPSAKRRELKQAMAAQSSPEATAPSPIESPHVATATADIDQVVPSSNTATPMQSSVPNLVTAQDSNLPQNPTGDATNNSQGVV